jgi:serine/threonine protein kinase
MTSDRASAGPKSGPSVEGPGEGPVLHSLADELQPGAIVEGKYQVEHVLGRGGMGIVVAATHLTLRERVALKFLLVRDDSADDFAARFKREAQVSARLRSEHVARVIDVGMWQGRAMYMVMEFLAGTDLRKLLRAQGPLSVETAIGYMVQVCEGMAEAHAHNVVHRDLKPSNLYLTKRPDGSDLVKILDFGISKWNPTDEEAGELTRTGVVLGSPKYVAPEQVFGSTVVDARADVWSLGAIFYEMLAGRPPFYFPTFARVCAELASGKPPPSLLEKRPDVPPAVEAVILRCLERDVSQRIPNVAELAGELLAAVGSPHAHAMRTRLYAMLETRSGGMPIATGSHPIASGQYSSFMTHSSMRRAYTSPIEEPEDEAEPSAKKRTLVMGAALAVALGVGTFFLANRISPPAAATAAAASPPALPAPVVPAAVQPTAKPQPVEAAPAAPAAASAEAKAPAKESPVRPAYRPAPRYTPAPARPAPQPAAAPVQEAPKPAAAPAPEPPPKRAPANPLEERQ